MAPKLDIEFQQGDLTPAEQSSVSAGFDEHTEAQDAPRYAKERVKWLATDEHGDVKAALTGEILWDWLYVDELWVDSELRGKGVGRQLMQRAEDYSRSQSLQGIWLWTQSWQAEGFYEQLGYSEFTRFDNFPRGHSRIGYRKSLT